MEQISIPGKDKIDISEGDLVLLVNNFKTGCLESGTLGLFESVVNHAPKQTCELSGKRKFLSRDYIRIRKPLLLKLCMELSEVKIPIVERPAYYMGDFFDFTITRSIRDVYAGQEKIILALLNMPGFEEHAKWISKLIKY